MNFLQKNYKKKETEYNKLVGELQNRAQEKQQSLQNSASDAAGRIQESLDKAIANVAKEKELDMVYLAQTLAYYDHTKDISKDILKEFNKILPKITVKQP